MKTTLTALGVTTFVLLLAGCNDSSDLTLKGSVTQATGQVNLVSGDGDQLALNTAAIGRSVSASFYDAGGHAALSMRFSDEVDPMILYFAESVQQLGPSIQAVNAHTQATNQAVTVDFYSGKVVPVNNQWDNTASCVFWQGTVQQCDSNGQNCQNVTKTIMGTAPFHYSQTGNINYDELKLTEASGNSVMELVDDETSTTSTQTGPCIRDPGQ